MNLTPRAHISCSRPPSTSIAPRSQDATSNVIPKIPSSAACWRRLTSKGSRIRERAHASSTSSNDQEYERFSISSEVDERTLREIYLEPFRIAIRNAKPWAVMSAYNRVNGTYASENDHTLNDILKGEWGYDGIVMSDWFGTYDKDVPSGGLDLEMPGAARWMSEEMVKRALDDGPLTEEALDGKVRRLLGVLEKAGLFDRPELKPERGENKPQHRQIIRAAAREAIVLLKNDGTLPLKQAVRSIAVIGPYAAQAQILGGGSSSVTPHYAVSPFEGIKNRAGKKIRVETAPGCHIYKNLPAPAPD